MVSILLIKEPICVFFLKKKIKYGYTQNLDLYTKFIQNFIVFFQIFFTRKNERFFCIYAYIANIHHNIHTNLNSEKRHGKLFSPILI